MLTPMRRLCAAAAALAALCAAASLHAQPVTPLRQAQDGALQRGLEQVAQRLGLEPAVQGGRLSLALVDLNEPNRPRLAMLNGDRMMYAASLPKIAILLAAVAEAEAGRLPLDDAHRAAMANMIRRSSNTDATQVLHRVGGERLLQILQAPRFAFYDRAEGGGLWVGKAYDSTPAFRRDPLANLSHAATAYQVARLYTALATGQLFSPPYTALMLEMLSRPAIAHKFVAGLAERPGAVLWRKSGTWQDTHADSALVESDGRRFVMVAIAQSPDGGEWLRRLAVPLHDLVVPPRAAATALAPR
ncbi:MAG: serine hydrolase [Rubrivivax sp.]|nr:serine hydrolase [Rubrivivax sp.]